MSLSLVIPSCVQVRLLWAFGDSPGINVLTASKTGTVTVDQSLANTLGAAIKAAFTSSGMVAHVSTSFALTKVGVRDINTAGNVEFLDNTAAVFGTEAGDPLPTQNACVVTLRTAKAGKSFRGRVYVGGFTEADNDSGRLISAAAGTAAVAWVNAINTAMVASSLKLAVGSRPAEKVTTTVETTHNDGTTSTKVHTTGPRAGTSQNVVSVELRNSIWDTQRKRAAAGSGSSLFVAPVQSITLT